ncbi:hypothetical protein KUCAC02_031506, partial [Chaenocephalus aceratus]
SEELQLVRDQLFCSGLSSEVKPPSERSGPELERSEGLREAAERSPAGSSLQTADPQDRIWRRDAQSHDPEEL